jgi:hypothetical protein
MVAPGFLQNEDVRNWLGGIEPAWTLLNYQSFVSLAEPPSPTGGAIRLAADLTDQELQKSAMAQNALVLLHAASDGPGLKLTATGNLSRSVVAEMYKLFTWPGYDMTGEFQFHKVVNEQDFLPLYFVRHTFQAAKLVRKHKDHLRITPAGRRLLEPRNSPALQAILFHTVFWTLDLSYLGRDRFGAWPQRDSGIVLWSLSVAGNGWATREDLTRICTIPIIGVLESGWDIGSYAMEAKMLRPLLWFGILEYRELDNPDTAGRKKHCYRKTALFDRFLSFDVQLEQTERRWH